MQTRSRNTFTSIHTEGSLLPVDLLQRVLAGDKDLGGLTPADYHLPGREKLNEAVNRSWNRLQGAWAAFQTSKNRLKAGDPGTTLTRERWLLPLFQELGYGRLVTAKAIEIEGKAYPISHGWANVPIHLVGCGIDLDRRAAGVAGASRSSPHSLVQELLNRADDRQWGIVANGLRLRILRDNASLTRQAYLEFDLEAMFSGDVYADFVLLWLLTHQSRFESADGKTEDPWLEKWAKAAQERGTRALDKLRTGVEEAITALGSGFLSHPNNQDLRKRLRSGELDAQDYYRQLLRLVYRLIFLFAAEDRDLLLDPGADTTARDRYLRYYSTARLRRLAERQRGGRHSDLWQGLLVVTDILGGKEFNREDAKSAKDSLERNKENSASFASLRLALGLPVLNGFLFSEKALHDLEASQVDNQALLTAIRSLAFTVEGRSLRGVDYKNLGPEELGSVYESLLELHPRINSEAGMFELSSASGHERKTTGSYYTPTSLIQVLLDSALDPVIEQAVEDAKQEFNRQDAKSAKDSSDKEKDFASLASSRLLNLKVCDPACGSGHFLIAAAHRIARRLAQIQSGGDEPPPSALRQALRAVIARCIYGVDVNPMAVELCKVNLWLESIEPGKPLSFLDAHIQCGDSLVGVGPGLDISEIPDEAFNPAFGDDKATASALKKRNKRERSGQLGFRWKVTEPTSAEDLVRWRAERLGQVDAMPEDDPTQVQAKAQAYAEYQETQEYIRNRLEYDLWAAAFFWPIPKGSAEQMLAPTQQELVMLRSKGELAPRLVEQVGQMAERLNFFHWDLAFPKVFYGENSGFDCVLGNPPWEKININQKEWFAIKAPSIAKARNAASRRSQIGELNDENPELWLSWSEASHTTDCRKKFIRNSSRYPFCGVGDINTYAVFAELSRHLISKDSRIGIIIPSGIATDATTQNFFKDILATRALVSMYEFENEGFFGAGQGHMVRFCLTTMADKGKAPNLADFIFQGKVLSELQVKSRHFSLSNSDVLLISPNSNSCPIFQTYHDAELAKKIYRNTPILINHLKNSNPWKVELKRMYHMSDDADLFATSEDLRSSGWSLSGNRFVRGKQWMIPLYEAKLAYQYNHRHGDFGDVSTGKRSHVLPAITAEKLSNPAYEIKPYYWVPKDDVEQRLSGTWDREWLMGWRDVTDARASARTLVPIIIPGYGVSGIPLIFLPKENILHATLLYANLASLITDYIARQKVGGLHLTYTSLEQIPIISPNSYKPADIDTITPRVLELVYTAYDLRPFAEDMGYYGEPFIWNENRRALLRAELDAHYARLYGLTRDELRYILDPQDVYGSDFPGETFRVLKDKEIRQYGEYRTRRLVLEAWDRLEGVEVGNADGYLTGTHRREAESAPTREVIAIQSEKKEDKPASPPKAASRPAVKEQEENIPAQPSFSDFGLYKCESCGKMVMGYEKEQHAREKHGFENVAWKKVR